MVRRMEDANLALFSDMANANDAMQSLTMALMCQEASRYVLLTLILKLA